MHVGWKLLTILAAGAAIAATGCHEKQEVTYERHVVVHEPVVAEEPGPPPAVVEPPPVVEERPPVVEERPPRVIEHRPAIVVQEEPPPVIVENRPPPPGNKHIWVDGYWRWNGNKYAWVPGHYERLHKGKYYVASRWVHTPRGWEFYEGYWTAG